MKKSNTSQIESHHIFALISGESGAGKTHCALTLPKDDTVIISAESGLLTLIGSGHEVWEVENPNDMAAVFGELKAGTKFKNVFIDSLTEIGERLFKDIKPNYSKSQNFGLYGDYFDQMIGMIKHFRDLTQYNIFATCLLKEADNGIRLDIGHKGLGSRLPSLFDFSFYVKVFEKEDKKIRALCSDNSVLPFLKSRSNKLEPFEQVNLTSIIKKVLSAKEN